MPVGWPRHGVILTVVCITLDTGMHMRTTMILDEALLAEARALTGLAEKTAVVHEGLRALIARESGRRLAALGGTAPQAWAPGRRRRVKRGTRKGR